MTLDLKRIVEGLLFASEGPVSLNQMATALETTDRAQLRQVLLELIDEYDQLDRAFELKEIAGGYHFRTKPELATWLRKLGRQQVTRLSKAALETLAIVAYKQPVLRAEIERIRGVDAGGVLRMLMEKDLCRVVGRKDLPGRPLIYGTTKRFLEVFELKDLSDLPTLEEMEALMGEGAHGDPESAEGEGPLFEQELQGEFPESGEPQAAGDDAPDAQDAQDAQDSQDAQDAQDAQDTPEAQDGPDGPDGQDVQDTPDAQDGPDVQDAQDGQGGQEAQDGQADPEALEPEPQAQPEPATDQSEASGLDPEPTQPDSAQDAEPAASGEPEEPLESHNRQLKPVPAESDEQPTQSQSAQEPDPESGPGGSGQV